MKFKLDDYARDFYGEKSYTIREGILTGKGKLVVERSIRTNWRPLYGYQEGMLVTTINGTEAKKFAKENNITIDEN